MSNRAGAACVIDALRCNVHASYCGQGGGTVDRGHSGILDPAEGFAIRMPFKFCAGPILTGRFRGSGELTRFFRRLRRESGIESVVSGA